MICYKNLSNTSLLSDFDLERIITAPIDSDET